MIGYGSAGAPLGGTPSCASACEVIFWNTGFRAALKHLAPLHLRTSEGGIDMDTEVAVRNDSRLFLVGYGSASSTVGATRAGRIAARELLKRMSGGRRSRQVPSPAPAAGHGEMSAPAAAPDAAGSSATR